LTLPGMLSAAAFWVVLEWIRSWFLSGLPWGLLAYSLHWWPALLQGAALFGIYGLSFLIVLLSLLIFRLVMIRNGRVVSAILLLLLVVSITVAGHWRLGLEKIRDSRAPKILAAVVQPSIPQELKWEPEFQDASLALYHDLTMGIVQVMDSSHSGVPRLVIWPETATPFYFQSSGSLRERLVRLASQTGGYLLFGSPAYSKTPDGRVLYRNRAYLLGPQGDILGYYDKRHLVPFGEYLPLGKLGRLVGRYIQSVGNYEPGLDCGPVKGGPFKIGVLICFENIFPWLAMDEVKEGANLLAVITNDAWFGRTEAPYQHETMAVLRAVETGRWVVRAANTGISSIITPWGERYRISDLGERGAFYSEVSLRSGHTPFTRIGTRGIIILMILLSFGGALLAIKHKS